VHAGKACFPLQPYRITCTVAFSFVSAESLRPFAINVRFASAGEAFIVFDARHARVNIFSKLAPPVRAVRLQWKPDFSSTLIYRRSGNNAVYLYSANQSLSI
jgi:hypothetical protein